MFKKLSVLIGLTETEVKVFLFLIATFVLGFGYNIFFQQKEINTQIAYDYSKEDSLFFAAGNNPELHEEEIQDKKSVDYKQEVLDFNTSAFTAKNITETPAEKSINLNTAGVDELVLLPGIGKKTAERIIELREERGKFNSLNELNDIKGIGESKFQKIIKYLYIK